MKTKLRADHSWENNRVAKEKSTGKVSLFVKYSFHAFFLEEKPNKMKITKDVKRVKDG